MKHLNAVSKLEFANYPLTPEQEQTVALYNAVLLIGGFLMSLLGKSPGQ